MISTGVVSSLIAEIIFIFTVPLLIAILLKIKIKAKFFPFFAGMMSCLFFQIEAENLIFSLVLSSSESIREIVMGNFLIYLFVKIINTLVFEVGGIWLVFRYLLRDYDAMNSAVNFGIGYGGFSAAFMYGASAFISLSYCLIYNDLGEQALIESMSEVDGADVASLISGIKGITPWTSIATTLDQLIDIAVITAVVIMVFFALKRKAPFYAKFACALMAVYTAGKTVTEYGLVHSMAVALLIDLVLGGIIVYAGYKVGKAYDYDEIDYHKVLM